MGQHRGDFAEGRERGQRIKVFFSSILFMGFDSFFLFFFRLGHDLGRKLGLNLVGLNGARLGRVQALEKKSV